MSQGGTVDNELMYQGSIGLAPGNILRVREAAGRCVGIVRGTVWITQAGDTCDHLVRAGGHFCFDRDGLALVWPLGDSVRLLLEQGIVAQPSPPEPLAVTRNNWFVYLPALEHRARRMRSEAIGQAIGLGLATLAQSLKALWRQISPVVAAAFQAVNTARNLPALSDSTLKDIGLRRDQISRLAQAPAHWRYGGRP
jgi:uncharacterized protein YjiS (DUF1127 family)